MLLIVDYANRFSERRALRTMFEARKQVFIDLLGWDLPVLADRFELDQFDDGAAVYLIVTDGESRHLASARLLDTTRPALLDGLYPDLVEGEVPRGSDIREITRFCLAPHVGARTRREARDKLLVGLAEYALAKTRSSAVPLRRRRAWSSGERRASCSGSCIRTGMPIRSAWSAGDRRRQAAGLSSGAPRPQYLRKFGAKRPRSPIRLNQ